ncbi:MAG: hypothetical protein HYX96_06815 [Chloroflexi bacterium]|nr:hypothetical protein [Chloroflexota bacterium]
MGNEFFASQPLPTSTNGKLVFSSDIAGLAVSADGSSVYVVNSGTTGSIFKSTDGGMTFTAITAPAAVTFTQIGVASDSPDSIVVSDGLNVYVSTNGGSQWTQLPQPAGPLAGTHTITSVAVGPARSGTLLGREYAIAVAHNTTNTVTGGDVLVLGGTTASWVSAGAPANTRDYMSVVFSPNFVGDRSVVALGAMSTASGGPNVAVQVFNTAGITTTTTGTLIVSTTLLAVASGASTLDFSTAPAGANIIRGSVALPKDYDATTSSGRRSYAGIAAFSGVGGITTDNDVYRVDDTTATRLSAFPGAGVWSVSYGGTIDAGTLFEGRESTNEIKYTTNPTSASPTWTTTKKLLPMTNINIAITGVGRTVVAASAKFATDNKVYAGTSGLESGFSVSTNGGLTFNQTGLIDNGVGPAGSELISSFDGFSTTSDGKTAYAASRATVGGNRWLSLWKSSIPIDSSTWIRLFVVPATTAATGRSNLRQAGEALYFFDFSLSGFIYRSTDGGDIFATRQAPSGITINTFQFEDANIMYATDGGPPVTGPVGTNIYKSTTGGWTWESPTSPGIGKIQSISIGNPGEIIVGGTGSIAVSKDAALTYTKYTGFAATDMYRIQKATDYATSSIIYLGDAVGATAGGSGGVYRYAIGKDPAFEDLSLPAALTLNGVKVGFGMRGGVMYVPTAATGIARSLYPTKPAGQQQWTVLDQPAAVFAAGASTISVGSPNNTIYIRASTVTTTVPGLWASFDYLASAKPKIKSPADKYSVSVDPSNGRANLVTFAIDPMGSGTGLVAMYEGQIAEKAAGFDAGILSTAITVTQPTSPTILMGTTAPGLGSGGWVFTMNSNTEYLVRFRAVAELSGENADSAWSDPVTLNVQSGGIINAPHLGPIIVGPQGGATGVALTPGFAWAPVPGATEYEVKLSTKADMSTPVAGTPVKVKMPAWQPSAALTAGTTYFWSVQAVSPTSGAVSISTFTTAAAPPKPAPTPKPTVAPPAKPAPAPTIVVTIPAPPPAQVIAPSYIWAIIIIGAILVIAVIVLIVRTRRPV